MGVFSHELEAPYRRLLDNIESGGVGGACCFVFQMGDFIARTGPIFELLLAQAIAAVHSGARHPGATLTQALDIRGPRNVRTR